MSTPASVPALGELSSVCHLVILDTARQRIAVSKHGHAWLLPFAKSTQPMACIGMALHQFDGGGVEATALHYAPFMPSAKPDTLQYYCVAESVGGTLPPRLTWQDLGSTTGARAMVLEQRLAIETALARGCHPEAPFDSATGVQSFQQWIDEQLLRRGTAAASFSWRRRARFDAVGICQTDVDRVYVKAGPSRLEEALLTEHFARLSPTSFSATVALDHDRHWWIGDEVPGQPLTTPIEHAAPLLRAVEIVSSIQRWTIDDPLTERLLAHRRIDAGALVDVLSLVWALMDADSIPTPRAIRDLVEERVLLACHDLATLAAPLSWVHSDLSVTNVLVSDTEIGLIDLEYGCWSLPPLALWRLLRETTDAPAVQAALVDAWLKAWQGIIDEERHHAVLNHLPLLGRLLRLRMLAERLTCQDGTPEALLSAMYLRILRPTIKGIVQAAKHPYTFARA